MDEPPNEADGVAEEQYILADSPSTLSRPEGHCLATISETRFPPTIPSILCRSIATPRRGHSLRRPCGEHLRQGTCIYLAAHCWPPEQRTVVVHGASPRKYAPSGIVTGTMFRDVELTVLGIPANDAWIVCLVNRHDSSSNGLS